jgi:hypothetical protein
MDGENQVRRRSGGKKATPSANIQRMAELLLQHQKRTLNVTDDLRRENRKVIKIIGGRGA